MPLPGAAAFLARVRELGGRIAIVTNRTQTECPDTEAVFGAHALAYDVMLCKPDSGPSDKNPRFEAVARGTTAAGLPPLEVVAFVGDNIQDFPRLGQALLKAEETVSRRLRPALLRAAESDVRQLGAHRGVARGYSMRWLTSPVWRFFRISLLRPSGMRSRLISQCHSSNGISSSVESTSSAPRHSGSSTASQRRVATER